MNWIECWLRANAIALEWWTICWTFHCWLWPESQAVNRTMRLQWMLRLDSQEWMQTHEWMCAQNVFSSIRIRDGDSLQVNVEWLKVNNKWVRVSVNLYKVENISILSHFSYRRFHYLYIFIDFETTKKYLKFKTKGIHRNNRFCCFQVISSQ